MNQADSDSENAAIEESRRAARRADPVSEHDHSIEIVSTRWAGPIPPPDELRQYDDLIPGAAERIMRMWEAQASQRIQAENRRIDQDERRIAQDDRRIEQDDRRIEIEGKRVQVESKRGYLGLAGAFALALLLIAIGAYGVVWGNPWVGVAVIGANIAGIAGIFVYGTNARLRASERKAADSAPRSDDDATPSP